MRKFIGTITIIVVLYLGFFGSQRFNVEPFIWNWLQSDKGQEAIEDTKQKIIEIADSVKIDKIHDYTKSNRTQLSTNA